MVSVFRCGAPWHKAIPKERKRSSTRQSPVAPGFCGLSNTIPHICRRPNPPGCLKEQPGIFVKKRSHRAGRWLRAGHFPRGSLFFFAPAAQSQNSVTSIRGNRVWGCPVSEHRWQMITRAVERSRFGNCAAAVVLHSTSFSRRGLSSRNIVLSLRSVGLGAPQTASLGLKLL